ncbi:hypothetical protein ACP70R_023071 [Stipagrostis hirtigluma subsp. patula]
MRTPSRRAPPRRARRGSVLPARRLWNEPTARVLLLPHAPSAAPPPARPCYFSSWRGRGRPAPPAVQDVDVRPPFCGGEYLARRSALNIQPELQDEVCLCSGRECRSAGGLDAAFVLANFAPIFLSPFSRKVFHEDKFYTYGSPE